MADYRTDITVVLPSLNPDEKFLRVVTELADAGFTDILIVNDGSDPDRLVWFEKAAAMPGCTVLTHTVNRGKGRALKTAFDIIAADLLILPSAVILYPAGRNRDGKGRSDHCQGHGGGQKLLHISLHESCSFILCQTWM